ncbi:hypothetical protein E1B28_009476 [Marasmius oreades]|uniref:RING-type domain-containing protein n=1 Tax=Marasmius oreades TaxID=181124 RepID=A0A9P7RV51_9AGAR|nr:uncharacterized protein E1B28_009476 [Marasmius oreades]KAG7090356.1 hypothetical protein E1B28_009476 [Marasmius oreades]
MAPETTLKIIHGSHNDAAPYTVLSKSLLSPPETPNRSRRSVLNDKYDQKLQKIFEMLQEACANESVMREELECQRSKELEMKKELELVKNLADTSASTIHLEVPCLSSAQHASADGYQALTAKIESKKHYFMEQLVNLRCGLCNQIVNDPYILDCSCIFCEYCIGDYHSEVKKSPEHGKPMKCPQDSCKQLVLMGPYQNKALKELAREFAKVMGEKMARRGVALWPGWNGKWYANHTL